MPVEPAVEPDTCAAPTDGISADHPHLPHAPWQTLQRKESHVSDQPNEHPTQSVAPGAESEQPGTNPPPGWVNPAQAAAAEFEPDPLNPDDRPANDDPSGRARG